MAKTNKKTNNTTRETIKTKGWKQGSCLYIEKTHPLITNDHILKKEGLYIVLSQDCDLLHKSFETEPFCELLYAKNIDKPNGNYIAGKNPRTIHITILINGENHHYECSIKDRFFISRKHLLEESFSPSSRHIVETKTKNNLIDWIVKRYNRTAFPDAFVKRIEKIAIKKLLEKEVRYIDGLYLNLHSFEELNSNEAYKIELYMLIEDDINNEKKESLKEKLEQIVNILEKNNKIIVSKHKIQNISHIPYGTWRDLYCFAFDYLSYR